MSEKQASTGRTKKGTFAKGKSGNPKGRPPAIPPQIKERLDQVSLDVLNVVVERAFGGDVSAARIVLDRTAPIPKAVTPAVVVPDLDKTTGLAERATLILNAVGKGSIPVDVGSTLIQSLAACGKLKELDELEQRIAALESGA